MPLDTSADVFDWNVNICDMIEGNTKIRWAWHHYIHDIRWTSRKIHENDVTSTSAHRHVIKVLKAIATRACMCACIRY